jgi:hypothetical protein
MLTPVILGVGILTIQTVYYTLKNMTVIESYEMDRVRTLISQGKVKEVFHSFHK